MPLRAQRRDSHEWAIVHALEARGCMVKRINEWGVPDLLVVPSDGRMRGRIVLLEVKQPAGPRGGTSAKGQKLNEAQADFFAFCYQAGAPCFMVRSVDEALERVGLL